VIKLYKAIKEKFAIINQREVAKKVGINECVLSRIINGHQTTRKTTAFCIVKAISENAEIEEYFTKGE
jgi:plasmid maintenance system antidote protein VapI